VRLLPWRLVLTTVSIFLVVAAADRHGLGSVLRDLAGPGTGSTALDAVRVAGVGALGSNAVNNLPAYLAIEPAVAGGGATARLVALVVGTNVGPLVTVWASLATLLWRERCRARGVEISWQRFMAEGVVVVVPMVVVTALSVAITG
jgi:arsenical pump membrane protein